MKPDIKWLDDPEVFRVMQLPAHSDHRIYADKEEMRTGRSSLYQVLDGIWDFHYSRNAAERPVRFKEASVRQPIIRWVPTGFGLT